MTSKYKIVDYRDYDINKMIEVLGKDDFENFAQNKLNVEVHQIIKAIMNPKFSHCRAGQNGGGSLNGLCHIYFHDEKSPTGVTHHMSSEEKLVSYLMRLFKDNSPLSPTEKR